MRRWQPQMLFRVRASAIILNQHHEILLVLHKDPLMKETYLMPPGGGLEAGENALEAVVREVKEECGVSCQPGELLYVREYISHNAELHHLGMFFRGELLEKQEKVVTGTDPELEHQLIQECRFYSQEELKNTTMDIYPEILKDVFWEDLKNQFLNHRVYLGQQRD